MAEEKDKQPPSSSRVEVRRFDKDLDKDLNDYHLPENEWTHARNAINNSKTGDLGKIGNEPSNMKCITAPYPIIGAIHLEADQWAIFSTDDVNSEIGFFKEEVCRYKTIVNDPCLNFKRTHLISGVSRETSDCDHVLYWDDRGLNPSRLLNIGDIRVALDHQDGTPWPNVPYFCVDVLPGPCIDCQPMLPLTLDCLKIRLAPLMQPLCFVVTKDAVGGELLTGSYFVVGAYTIRGIKYTNYFPPSNIQPIFFHNGVGGSIKITVTNADTDFFDEFELVVVSIIAQQTQARRLGIYSTRQKEITLDIIDNMLESVPVENIPIRIPIVDTTDGMFNVNEFLIRVGPKNKFDFNYQPLANQIVAKWQSVEYPQDYYKNGGYKTGYMRDEVYSFFIRFIYDTGDRSPSYHIPGRPPMMGIDIDPATGVFLNGNIGDSDPEVAGNIVPYKWIVENTALTGAVMNIDLEDGGKVIREGYMGYWESTELYPDNKPDIWNANINYAPYPLTGHSDYDICGKAIRHHRFPDTDLNPDTTIFNTITTNSDVKTTIRIMGVAFENIKRPVLNDGVTPVPGIICFEILRGSRKGNRTVIAKGMLNNMVEYDIPNEVTQRTGLFQNYPYNDMLGDKFLSTKKTQWLHGCEFGYTDDNDELIGSADEHELDFKASQYRHDIFTFHSPETTFSNPFLSSKELKVYENICGVSEHRYQFPAEHPKHKLLKDIAWVFAGMAGLGAGLVAASGKVVRNYSNLTSTGGIGSLYEATGLGAFVQMTGMTSELYGGITGGIPILANIPIINTMTFAPQNNATVESTGLGAIGAIFSTMTAALSGMPLFTYYWAEGAEATWRIIKAATNYRQHALQQMSHCLYDNTKLNTIYSPTNGPFPFGSTTLKESIGYSSRAPGQRRRLIGTINYLDNQVQDYTLDFRVNNLYRPNTVILNTVDTTGLAAKTLLNPSDVGSGGSGVIPVDDTRYRTLIKDLAYDIDFATSTKQHWYKNPERGFKRNSSSYYAAIKQRLRNQYGQLNGITQLPVMPCPYCCLDGDPIVEQIVNGYFEDMTNHFTGWSAYQPGTWIPGYASGNWFAETVLYNPPHSALYQTTNINYIPGAVYQLSFDILQLDPKNTVGLSLTWPGVATGPLPASYVYQTTGSYTLNFMANNVNNNVVFTEDNSGACPDFPTITVAHLTSAFTNPTCSSTPATCYTNSFNAAGIESHIGIASSSYLTQPGLTVHLGAGNIRRFSTSYCNGGVLFPNPIHYDDITDAYLEGDDTFCIEVFWTITGQRLVGSSNAEITFGILILRPNGEFITTPVGTGCQLTISTTTPPPVVKDHLDPGGVLYTVYTVADSASNGTILSGSTQSGSTQFPSFTLAPGEKAIPFIAMHEAWIFTFDMTIRKLEGIPTRIDNVTLKRISCKPEPFKTDTIFGGDVYINRYTEKNTFYYFYNWLVRQPDGAEFDYYKYKMLPYPTYWMNSEEFDVLEGITSFADMLNPASVLAESIASMTGFISDLGQWIQDIGTANPNPPPIVIPTPPTPNIPTVFDFYNKLRLPSDYHVLDRPIARWENFIFDIFNTNDNLALTCGGPGMAIKYGYFYLFNSGVRDFFVESEYNVALRDWEDPVDKRHYDYREFTDLPDLFHIDFIKAPNYYRYESSLSISRNWFSTVKWGNVQDRYYDPEKAETCYQYKPNRLIYSLPAVFEHKQDNWRIFLPNNYKDFLSKPVAVKQINQSGAVILFEADSPVMFQGTDQLQTTLGTKLTIGDGGLFAQPMQNIINADRPYEFGSSQNSRSIINTPAGTFWISQNQGKIFELAKGLKEISLARMKWWLAQHLPYQLTKEFPEFTLTDNAVVGIGCQSIYDNENQILYFTKRDYIVVTSFREFVFWDTEQESFVFDYTLYSQTPPRATCPIGYAFNAATGLCEKYVDYIESLFCPPNYAYNPSTGQCDSTLDPPAASVPIAIEPCDPADCTVEYIPGNAYCRCLETVEPIFKNYTLPIDIHDPLFFKDASWTISYDPKIEGWLSWHDWHPDLLIPGKNTFMSVLNDPGLLFRDPNIVYNTIWVHNKLCDSYTKYYGKNYPFEVEYMVYTPLQVNTLRSIEYQLECYKYAANCYDRFHNLDFNFDEAIVYNTEQASGLLKLNLTPKNNPVLMMNYPSITTAGPGLGGTINILYSKEENKYRFNQFWDATFNRGEFPLGSAYPPPTPLLGSYAERMIWNTEANGYVKNLNASNLDYGKDPVQRKKFRHYTTSVFLRRKAFPQGELSYNPYKMLINFVMNKTLNSPR